MTLKDGISVGNSVGVARMSDCALFDGILFNFLYRPYSTIVTAPGLKRSSRTLKRSAGGGEGGSLSLLLLLARKG